MSSGRGRNEGAVDLSYKPPGGFKQIKSTDEEAVESGFEWSNINNNPDLDIWAIRIPAGLKASDLAGLKIQLPQGGAGDITGKLKKDGANFTLQTVGGDSASGAGEEMQNMRCMVPKASEDGELYTTTKPLKHLILVQQDPIPAPTAAPAQPAQPLRRQQPTDRLKHSFAPIGASPLSPPRSSSPKLMEVDTAPAEPTKKKRKKQVAAVEVKMETPKSKSKAKATDEVKAATSVKEEAMEIDGVASAVPKKSRKKSMTATEAQSQEAEPSVKKEKKKRKAAGDD
ncbi:hypothetical protein FRC12_007246 [Ceratobasidium sp. 428]|nr:hypothetical protein FRC12_007246 [Ceratobasidium sp. 428]